MSAPERPRPAIGTGSYGIPGDAAREIATVTAIYDAFSRRDLDAALRHLAHDVELALPHTARLAGRERPYLGHDGVRAYFSDLAQVWGELSLHADDIRAISGGVIVFGYVRGVLGQDVVRKRVVWAWKLRDGLAVSVRASELPGG